MQNNPNRFGMKLGHQVSLPYQGKPPPPVKKEQQQLQPVDEHLMTFDEFQVCEKSIYSADKIVENYQVNTWNNNFLYKQVNNESLNSTFVDTNPQFQEMKSMLVEYNKEIRDASMKNSQVRNGPWRSVFFTQLLNLMREVILTTNRDLQQKFIEKIYTWVTQQVAKMDYQGRNKDRLRPETGKTRPETGKSRPFSSSLKRPISGMTGVTNSGKMLVRPISGYPFTLGGDTIGESTLNISFDTRPESAKQNTIGEDGTIIGGRINQSAQVVSKRQKQPSEIINEQMKDYNAHSRTNHQDYEAPNLRLTTYKRRQLSSVEPKHERLQITAASEKKRTFPKPKSNKASIEHVQIEQTKQSSVHDILNSLNDKPQIDQDQQLEQLQNQEMLDIQKLTSENSKKDLSTLEPRVKVFKIDEQGDEKFNRDLNKKFELRSTYAQYEPSLNPKEMRNEERYIKNRHREAAQKREDQELIGYMQDWAQNKGRVEKEISRRIESANYGNHFKQVEMQERNNKQDDYKEIEKIQAKHKKYLQEGKKNDDLDLSDLSQSEPQEEEFQIREDLEPIEGDSELIEEGSQNLRVRPQSTIVQRNRLVDMKDQLPPVQKQVKFKNNTDFHDLELKINNKKINDAKKLHGQIIGLLGKASDSVDQPTVSTSLSIYAREDKPKPYRPFSAALEICPTDVARQEQLQEIAEVKARLAKHKINIPVQKLMNAMLIPDPVLIHDPAGIMIPDIGYGMLDRDDKTKKKKKKNSRSKKKRRN